MSAREATLSASDFKARCLEVMRQIEKGELQRVTVTRRGKSVAVLQGVQHEKPYKDDFGFMRGLIHLAPDYDPFEQVIEESDDPFIGKASVQDAD